jgi:uncharacterized membrane protein YfcA
MNLLGLVLAIFIGLSLGLLGGGGSILTVPILVYVSGFAPKQAIAMTLPIVGITSIAGAMLHWRQGNVRIATAIPFGLIAMAGAYLGARVSLLVTGSAQLLLLGVIMLSVAVSMLLRGPRKPEPAGDQRSGRWATLGLLAITVGLLTGLVGIGGGFLVVPALVLGTSLHTREAIGTSLVVIAMNAAAGLIGYTGRISVPWGYTGAFAAVALLGILLGSRLNQQLSGETLRKAFAVFLILVGVYVIVQNRAVIRNGLTPERSVHADQVRS